MELLIASPIAGGGAADANWLSDRAVLSTIVQPLRHLRPCSGELVLQRGRSCFPELGYIGARVCCKSFDGFNFYFSVAVHFSTPVPGSPFDSGISPVFLALSASQNFTLFRRSKLRYSSFLANCCDESFMSPHPNHDSAESRPTREQPNTKFR